MKGGGSGFGSGRFVLAVNYTISAKETKYKGIWFRSRLEARWAAFFDLIGVKYHYEPFDLPGWSPDFLIQNDVMDAGPITWLLEVKPILAPDDALFNKIEGALEAGVSANAAPLLVGLAPRFEYRYDPPHVAWGRYGGKAHDMSLLVIIPTSEWPKARSRGEGYWENMWGEAHNLSRFWKPKP